MSPKDNNKQVSAAVRILQQKRDASARATHLMVKNDPLITYEKAFLNQAAVKKFFIATFLERKIMSTKTSIKRIALVAAAALALGGVSVLTATSASAAYTPTVVYSNIYDTTNGYQVVGGEATVTVRFDTVTAATVVSTGVGTIASADWASGSDSVGVDTLTAVTSTSFRKPITDAAAHYELLRCHSGRCMCIGASQPDSPGVVTVMVTVDSKMPSASGSAPTSSATSIAGASCSRKMAGEFGCSSDMSFR
jgi:hypothetical protein